MDKSKRARFGGFVRIDDFGTGDIRRHQIGRKLNPVETQGERLREASNHECVSGASRLQHGRAEAGLLFAFWSMGTKLALAVAIGFALPGVEAFGFDPDFPTKSGIESLVFIYAILPVASKVAAVGLMWHFPLTEKRHAAVCRRLARNTAGNGMEVRVSL